MKALEVKGNFYGFTKINQKYLGTKCTFSISKQMLVRNMAIAILWLLNSRAI